MTGLGKLLGKPFTEDSRTFFRIKDLKEYLLKHRFTEMDTNRIASKLRDMKAEHKFLNLKGRGVNVWSIAEFEYGADDLELEPTNFEGSDI